MTVRIHYETPDGIETVTRDERHYEHPDIVTAFDNPTDAGVTRKVEIPTSRVVRVTHPEQERLQ